MARAQPRKRTLRIFFVERSRSRAAKLARALQPLGEIDWEWTANPNDAGLRGADDPPDAILADWDTIGGIEGVRAIGFHPESPLIITSGKLQQDDVVSCVKAGAVDCVRRTNLPRLRAALAEALERHEVEPEGRIDQTRYRELMRDLSRAEKTRAEFVGNLSHELRTPLNVIIGYSDMLLDQAFGGLNADQDKTIGRINKQARELLDLVNTTLELSRIEAGRIPLKVEPVDVAAVLTEIEEETAVLASGKQIDLRREIPASLPQPHTDPVKLKVIVKNLVTNALKFTERGAVRISGRARDDGIEIAVVDTGPGIAGDQIETIFEAFEQGDTARGQRGAGLGLHIVQRLLAILGGEISLQSELGKGSEFRVWIPLHRRDGGEDESEERVSAA